MDHDSRNRLSPEARAVNVAAASGADMVVNFPLRIAAKRLSAGLPLPRLGEIYKGSGALYLAFFPMMVVEDWATGVVDRTPATASAAVLRRHASGRRRRCSSARRWRA